MSRSSSKPQGATNTVARTITTSLEVSGADVSRILLAHLGLTEKPNAFVQYTFEGDFTLVSATVSYREHEEEVAIP